MQKFPLIILIAIGAIVVLVWHFDTEAPAPVAEHTMPAEETLTPTTPDSGEETMTKDVETESPVDSVADTTAGAELPTPVPTELAAGTYTTYSADKVAAANGDVVLFFKADWCPSCRSLDSNIKAHLNDIPAGVTILEVDYDTETALKQKYGVTTQHTLVQVDATGTMIKKWSGSPRLQNILTELN